MAIKIVLVNFTNQGIRHIKDTTRRADAITAMAKKFGVTAKGNDWTKESNDVVDIFDAPHDVSMTAFLAAFGAMGNARTTTLWACS